ncbi:MAG: PAS domain-containing protein [Evtepia sp.]
MTEQENLRSVIRKFMESVLFQHDVETALETVSDNIIGVGMGDQGTISTKEQLRTSLKRMNMTASAPVAVNYSREDIRFHPPSFATATLVYEVVTEVEGSISKSSFIQTVAAKKEQDLWKICLLQAAPLTFTVETIENYPLQFADTVLSDLKIEMQLNTFDLMNKNFSGGIFGTYVTKDFPLYFANETFIRNLGYTHQEFYDTFRNDVSKLIYPLDKARVLAEVHNYLKDNITECKLKFRLLKKDGSFAWVIEHARKTEDENGIPILLGITTNITEMVELQNKLETQNKMILAGMHYASKIQRDSLPDFSVFKKAFSDASVIWEPRDIVGGDLYQLKTGTNGSVLGICDCTGHGTPGALLSMLVASTFNTIADENIVKTTAELVLELDFRMSEVLNAHVGKTELSHIRDGCDLAILFIKKDGSVEISSSGMHVFICDGTAVRKIKGPKLHIGEGRCDTADKITISTILPNPNNTFYIASDGLYDQIGGALAHPFGYRIFEKIILEHHAETQSAISQKIWDAFELYRGDEPRRDDVELISFKP